jgi:hypothetical protein
MAPERLKCAVREAPEKTSITRQHLARRISAATDRLVETKALSHVYVSTDKQQTVSMVTGDYISIGSVSSFDIRP